MLKNVLTQSYKTKGVNYEIIIVDDNSKDKTREILAQYKNQRKINTLFLNENGGPAKARNFGAKNPEVNIYSFLMLIPGLIVIV